MLSKEVKRDDIKQHHINYRFTSIYEMHHIKGQKPGVLDNDLDDSRKRNVQHARSLIHLDLEGHFSQGPIGGKMLVK